MATELFTHPTSEQLRAFAQGRLSSAEMTELEQHIAYCDSCCLHLARVPDDTLVQLAREAATQGVKAPAATRALPAAKPPIGEIPKELRDHPRYRVLSLVGHGGMGAVYKAEHRMMERLVALKVINPSLMANPHAVDRFNREFRAAAKLSHPNIVAAHDADHAGDLHFFVMEFVDGVSLDRLVAHNGPLSPMHAAYLIYQAAQGLQHAHEKGMVHRDIKPQNLMMTRQKKIKILDFGLIRLCADQAMDVLTDSEPSGKPGQTTAGMVLGTPDYIAPEQVTDARTADGRADIYSLGCTLYYLLTGQPPFPSGTTIEKLNLHLKSAPPSVATRRSDVPAELLRILDKMLAKDPAQRYQTPGELAKDLAPLAKGQGGVGQASRQPEASGRREPPGNFDSPEIAIAAAGDLVPVPSTEYAALSTSPFDDPALALSISPLRPVIQPPQPIALPFGLTPPAAVGIGVGSVALLALLAWGISSAFSGNGDPPDPIAQQQTNVPSSNSHTVPTPPLNSPSVQYPPTAPAIVNTSTPPSPSTDGTGVIGKSLPRRVLLVVPSRGLWANDYWRLQPSLKSLGVETTVASTSLDAVTQKDGTPTKIVPDLLLDQNVRADDYGAVIFAGYATEDFHPEGSAGQQTRRILREFRDKGRIISSICVGLRVLEAHELLDGKDVAYSHYMEKDFGGSSGNEKNEGVVEHDLIITAGADRDGPALAAVIERYLQDR
jgi:eukaryotic-like serine/threonine-protein kinase